MELQIKLGGVVSDKAAVKLCIVSNNGTAVTKFEKFGQDRIDVRLVRDHFIGNTGQVGYVRRNRNSGVDKL